ncbi:hypothetical protein [Bosea vaviloviae]|uniref:Uncharacterized protein n=1 Tax=Bosea vaviloviae TaxID=1526658 RepID=A0A1D7TVQ1_9HYPH|nr:hypothetical protein [Bosea vaviloviae]AOO79202.1 hypothetical protein BHK69_00655 [Bosea vaviloviae]
MPLASRALVAAFACLLTTAPAFAAITDPEMTCAAYLKSSAAGHRQPKTHQANVEARIRAFCAANPKMKAVDAEMTVTGD